MPQDPRAPDPRAPKDTWGFPLPTDQSQPLIPHALTFGMLMNTVFRTYSYRWDEAIRQFGTNALAMKRDAYLLSLLQERAYPTANRRWQIKPDNPKDLQQVNAAKRVEASIRKIKKRRKLFLYLAKNGLWYGRCGAQIAYGERFLGDGTRGAVISKYKPVNGDKIQFDWDDNPVIFINATSASRYPAENIVYTDRVPGLRINKKAWREQFIIHQHEIEDADYFEGEMSGNVQGLGLRGMTYWGWWMRDEVLSWAVNFMEKVGSLGLTVIWYEDGNETAKKAAEKAMQRVSKDTVLLVPRPPGSDKSWGIDHFDANLTGVEALKGMIQDYFEHNIERLWVGQSLSSGTEGNGLGGAGVADLHRDTKFQLLQYDADNLADTLSEDLVAPLHAKLNPGAQFDLEFCFNTGTSENKEKMDAVKNATSMGVTFIAAEVRDLTGMSAPTPGDVTIGGQQASSPVAPQPGETAGAAAGGGGPISPMGPISPSDQGAEEDPQAAVEGALRQIFEAMHQGIPGYPMPDDDYIQHLAASKVAQYQQKQEAAANYATSLGLVVYNKSGIFTDKLGHKYKLQEGKRVPIGEQQPGGGKAGGSGPIDQGGPRDRTQGASTTGAGRSTRAENGGDGRGVPTQSVGTSGTAARVEANQERLTPPTPQESEAAADEFLSQNSDLAQGPQAGGIKNFLINAYARTFNALTSIALGGGIGPVARNIIGAVDFEPDDFTNPIIMVGHHGSGLGGEHQASGGEDPFKAATGGLVSANIAMKAASFIGGKLLYTLTTSKADRAEHARKRGLGDYKPKQANYSKDLAWEMFERGWNAAQAVNYHE